MDLEAILDEEVSIEDLKKFEKIYNDQVARGEPSTKAAFDYALCLVRSSKRNVRLGIKLLEELLSREFELDESKREYLYYLAVGYMKVKDYDVALRYIGTLIRGEPSNRQAKALEDLIKKRMKRDAAFGAAIIGAASLIGATVLVGAIAAFVRRGGPKK